MTIINPTVLKPMKLTDVGPAEAEKYIADPNWIMQQKLDGARMITIVTRAKDGTDGYDVLYTNDGVKPIAFSAAKLKLPDLGFELMDALDEMAIDEITLDGELIIEDGVYHVFDVLHLQSPRMAPGSLLGMPLEGRLRLLERLGAEKLTGTLVQLSHTAHTPTEKRQLWEKVQALGVEGAVSKHLDSMYVPGARSKEWVKHKLVKSADVIVVSHDRTFDEKGMVTHGSAALAVHIDPRDDPEPWVNKKTGKRLGARDWEKLPTLKMGGFDYLPRTLLPVGNSSLIGKDLTITDGSVVEIEYLYWTGKAVIQPRITRKREDKPSGQCDLSQFPLYTRSVAWRRF
jgi:ATP-dependent DNA ligase